MASISAEALQLLMPHFHRAKAIMIAMAMATSLNWIYNISLRLFPLSESNRDSDIAKMGTEPLADLGGVPGARPLRVQILLFRHTKFSKRNRLGSQRPPPTGNPGSATENPFLSDVAIAITIAQWKWAITPRIP